MTRRSIGLIFTFSLALTILTVLLAADAQQSTKVYRIGRLSSGSPPDVQRTAEAFRQGLRDLGYIEGQNLVIEYRWAEGREERLPDLAAELVRLPVDVLVAVSAPAARALGVELHCWTYAMPTHWTPP